MQLPKHFRVTWVLLVVCFFSMGSSHRIAKPSRNYMGVLKQNFDRICAKIAILEGKVNGQEGKLSDQEETLRDQEEKLRNQEEELNDLKMQRDDKETQLSILEERVNELEIQIKKTEYESAFAISGYNPAEAASGVMTVPQEGVITNLGDNYNPTTGQYMAPYDGTYVFGLHLYKDTSVTNPVFCSIRKNEEKVVVAYVAEANGIHEGSTAVVIHLDKNDIVYVGGCSKVDALFGYTAFFGHLLKAD